MAHKSGPISCLRHKFALGETTVVVDWRQVARASPKVEEQAASDKQKAKPKLPGGDVPGKGAATFASLVQDLEARHVGKRGGADSGYFRDGFVISDDEETNDFEEDEEVSPDDFYVTQAPTERRKRAHSEVTGPEETEADIATKRRKLQEEMTSLAPTVKDALARFQEDWTNFTKGALLSRFPPELEASLVHTHNVIAAQHPKRWVSAEVFELLSEISGFTTHTLKAKLTKARKSGGDPHHTGPVSAPTHPIDGASNGAHTGAHGKDSVATSSAAPAPAAPSVGHGPTLIPALPSAVTNEAMAALRHAGKEFEDVLALPDDQRNQELQQLLELHIEQFSQLIRDFVSSLKEPPKRSPWNEPMRQKIKLLFAINDSCVPPPVPASTLRAHLLSLWPESWDVRDTQIKPLTRYVPKPAKAHDA